MVTKKKLPRLVDIAVPPSCEGEHVTLASILDKEVVVTKFTYIPSQFQDRLDYLAIQIERNGQRQWFTTQSSYIIDFFERVAQESLPCLCTFSVSKDAEGNYCYSVS